MQVRIFLVVLLVTGALMVQRLIVDDINPLWALLGVGTGFAVGWLLVRTKPLRWDRTERQVTASSTALGAIAIVLYMLVVFMKDRIVGGWIDNGEIVGVVTIAFTVGVMLGRVWITLRGIREVLRATTLVHDHDQAAG